MNKWIILVLLVGLTRPDGTPIFVNLDMVQTIGGKNSSCNGHTLLQMIGVMQCVKETPEAIKKSAGQ